MNYINEKETNKIFSKNLKYYLNLNDISQVDLAKKINVTPASISNWCNGIKTPRMDKIDKLCSFFNISRSDLIEDKPKQNNIELSNQEKSIIIRYRKLNMQEQIEVSSYIDFKLNHRNNTVKESTPVYKIDNNTHSIAAEQDYTPEYVEARKIAYGATEDETYIVDKKAYDKVEKERQKEINNRNSDEEEVIQNLMNATGKSKEECYEIMKKTLGID